MSAGCDESAGTAGMSLDDGVRTNLGSAFTAQSECATCEADDCLNAASDERSCSTQGGAQHDSASTLFWHHRALRAADVLNDEELVWYERFQAARLDVFRLARWAEDDLCLSGQLGKLTALNNVAEPKWLQHSVAIPKNAPKKNHASSSEIGRAHV